MNLESNFNPALPGIAWIQHGDLAWVEFQTPLKSAAINLIERIYFSEPRAREILRERIFSNVPASITDLETVKVGAKRITSGAREIPEKIQALLTTKIENQDRKLTLPPPFEMGSDFEKFGLKRHEKIEPAGIAAILECLKMKGLTGISRSTSDRAVSALLVDAEFMPIAAAWNTNSLIRTRHAEWNLLDSWGKPIPRNAKLFVSLKPCRMCAARIWESVESPSDFEVTYFENDPGPFAQNTMLDSGSAARRRHLGAADPHYHLENMRMVY
ncbi:MAG: Bd3614 family nucleic acid deaminase [Cryobacterium sp.]|nr:Bd3614 family nucleic acid deaminase [Oligoflexia bacterium]